MTLKDIRAEMRSALASAVGDAEAKAMTDIVIEDVLGYKAVDIALNPGRELLDGTVEQMRRIVSRVVAGEPLQYVIGTARFRGRDFIVSPAVLIPRPETAQLVDLIVDDFGSKPDCRVLDVGTGSGCIAISLALDLRYAQVEAVDISPAALDVAQRNSAKHRTKVMLRLCDALTELPQKCRSPYDVIVSNPPYVLASEGAAMDARVLDHEPPTALFVPDDDPLRFYRPIAEFAFGALAPGGRLYFEINPLCAAQLKQMLRDVGFHRVDSLCDYRGAVRFIIASL